MDSRERKINEHAEKIAKELPLGDELDKAAVDLEIDLLTKREDLFEILKPIGVGILKGDKLSPEEEEKIREKLIKKFEENNK